MCRTYLRHENALKRAQEFLDVQKPNKALDVLYEVIKRSKMRANYSEKILQPIMHKFVELCVDQKQSHYAKEGLYQFRNIFQNVNVMALENAVRHLLQLADQRTESARVESHQAVVDVEDLDCPRTSEEIILSAVSGEDAQDRSDRTILTPWVKFLWEVYRHCLDLLRINSKVERLYHDIARHAFRFCEKYDRKTEFRKLCENMRNHTLNLQKQQGSSTTVVNLNNPETQQMTLETRLDQLNYAIKMELWQEAYKAIEDISDLMTKSKKMPKPHVMASYYQKLALVFWKAGNQLFHAAALFKLFQLLRDQKKNITPEELSKRASTVLVATLAIPLPSAHPEFDRFIGTEKSALEKIDRLASLLNFTKPPTRLSLIRDLNRLNIVSHVFPELQNMYNLMETEFDPLNLCQRMQNHFEWINDHTDSVLPQYVTALQYMTTCRLIKQVAQIYQTIKFERLLELAVFVTAPQLERILVDLVRHNDLQIRIDQRNECVHFGKELRESQREHLEEGPSLQILPSENIRCQLVQMSSAAQKCIALIVPDIKKKEMEPIRAQTLKLYHQTKTNDHRRLLQRQHIIEERKELLETQNQQREDLQRKQLEEQQQREKDKEQERLQREAIKREKDRHEEQIKEIQTKQIEEKLLQMSKTTYGAKMIEKFDKKELLSLGTDEIIQRQVEELEKEQKDHQRKLKFQGKFINHNERAKRIIETPRLKKVLDKKKIEDKDLWMVQEKERVTKLSDEHVSAHENCERLSNLRDDEDSFVEKIMSQRLSENQKKVADFIVKFDAEREKRMEERKETRKQERKDAYYKQKAEEEQQRKDEELKKQREEEEIMQREEEERSNHTNEKENNRSATAGRSDDRNAGPWRVNKGASSVKEKEKMDAWRVKDDGCRPRSTRDTDRPDAWRTRDKEEKPEGSRFVSRDIRRDEKRDDLRRENREDLRRENREDQRDDRRDGDRFKDGPTQRDDGSNRDSWRGAGESRFGDQDKNRKDEGRDYRRNDDRDMRRDFRRDDKRDFRRDDRRMGGDRRDNERRDDRRDNERRDDRRDNERRDDRGNNTSWRGAKTDENEGEDRNKNGNTDNWRSTGGSSRFKERDQGQDKYRRRY